MTPAAYTSDYAAFLTEVKGRIHSARLQAGRAVNGELVMLYWDIGRGIVEKQKTAGWGEAVVERLAADLWAEFPDMRGFSGRNLRDMKRFYRAYSDEEFWRQAVATFAGKERKREFLPQAVAKLPASPGSCEVWPQAVATLPEDSRVPFLQQLVADIPWGHHRLILDKLTDPAARLFYLRATAQCGWSRSVLLNQIKRERMSGR